MNISNLIVKVAPKMIVYWNTAVALKKLKKQTSKIEEIDGNLYLLAKSRAISSNFEEIKTS